MAAQPLPVLAQGEPVSAEEAIANARDAWSAAPQPEANPCDDVTDDPDVIIVCRQWESGEQYRLNRGPQRLRGSQVTETAGGAPRAPDFDESCLHNRGRENCMMGGWVPPPAIMVDFSALPETPEGSEAALLYGGPTDADEVHATIEAEQVDLGEQMLRGTQDTVVGP